MHTPLEARTELPTITKLTITMTAAQWYSYINFLRYAWGALMISQFRGKTYTDADGVDSEITIGGKPILKYYGLEDYTEWEMLGYELLFFFVFFAAAWAALQFMRLSKR
jgi:ATP-binding cassette, subfamily G (WHITE), member 2